MRFAIFSDIHGNIFALKACFEKLNELSVDRIIWCGDYITDIPRSHEVIEFIKSAISKYTSYIIKGNREDYIIEYNKSKDNTWTMENNNGPLLCAYNELDDEDIKFISNLPNEYIIDIPNIPKIYVSHKINYDMDKKYRYKIFGHSHKRCSFVKDTVVYINPGSLGIPTNGNAGADFSILELDGNNYNIEYYHVQYDILEPIQAIKNSIIYKTRIKWGSALIKSICTGSDYIQIYIEKVLQIAREREENLGNIPMSIWDKASKGLNL